MRSRSRPGQATTTSTPRLEGLLLGLGGDPAEDGGDVHVDDAGQGLDDLGDLEGELTGGGQDQADGVAGAGLVLLRQTLDQRQAEGQGLARAGAAAAEHVAPRKGVGAGWRPGWGRAW